MCFSFSTQTKKFDIMSNRLVSLVIQLLVIMWKQIARVWAAQQSWANRTKVQKETQDAQAVEQRYKMPWIESMLQVMIDFGYYTLSQPLIWIPAAAKFKINPSKWHKRIRGLLVAVIVVSTTCQIIFLGRGLRSDELHIHSFKTTTRVIIALVCTICTFFQIHTAFRVVHIQIFANMALSYLDLMRKHRILDSPKGFDHLCAVILTFYVSVIFAGIGFGLGISAYDCELHALSGILPICETKVLSGVLQYQYRSPEWFLFYISLELLLFIVHGASIIYYIPILIIPVLGCKRILSKMRLSNSKTSSTNILQRNKRLWLLHYRCLQILFQMVFLCMGEFVVPCWLFSSVAVIVVLNYTFITFGFELISVIFVGMYGLELILFVTVIREGIFFTEISNQILNDRKSLCRCQNGWFAKILKTCVPLRIRAGTSCLQRLSLFKLIDVSFQSTVPFLLRFK